MPQATLRGDECLLESGSKMACPVKDIQPKLALCCACANMHAVRVQTTPVDLLLQQTHQNVLHHLHHSSAVSQGEALSQTPMGFNYLHHSSAVSQHETLSWTWLG